MARVPKFNQSGTISQVAAQPGPAAGAGFGALAEAAKIGEEFLRPKAIENAKVAGAKAVYRDENGQLQIDERNVLGGELADAHNSAAYAKYMSQRSIDIRDTMTELATQHQFNPGGFREATNAYTALLRDEEGVPPLLREDLVAQAEREASSRFNGLMVSEVNRTHREADIQTSAHRDAVADDYINLMMSGDAEAAAEKLAEMQAITDFRASAPYITETPAQSEAYMSGTRGAARAAQLSRKLEDLSGARSITPEERQEVQDLLDDPDIDPRTRQRLYGATQGRLQGIDGRAAADALAATDLDAAVRNHNYGTTPDVPQGYLDAIRSAESGGDDSARNSKSSATGRYQFIESTWADLMQKHPDLGLTVDGRLDPAQQERAIRAFTADNARVLANAGIPSTGGNLYAAHFLGAGDATRVLGASDNQQLADLLSDGVMEANPFLKGMTVAGFREWSARKGGDQGFDASPTPNFAANREALQGAGINITPGSEFFAGAFGVDEATALFQADPEAAAADVLSPEMIEANPVLNNMTVEQAQAWADRRAVVKASDIAARRTQVDQIENDEVRAIALTALNDHYNQRRRAEDAAAAEYTERLDAQDDSLTEREVMADHSISDQAQRTIVAKLRDQRADQIAISETLADLNDADHRWDAYDSGARNSVDKAYSAMLDGADPLSTEGQAAGAAVALRSGFVPKTMFNAIRGAVNGNDPQAMGAALEFAGQITQAHPGAMRPYGGDGEVISALDDYRFYSGFMGSEEAAGRIIENNSPENRSRRANLSDEAREHAKDLQPSDIESHFSELGSDVSVPENIEGVLMGDYERLFKEAYTATGDVSLAKNRALSDISRIYGPSGVGGSDAIMRYPPASFYAPVNGSQDWMGDQLVADVSEFAFGEQPDVPDDALGLTATAITSVFMGSTRVDPESIFITSDERTQQDVASGAAPSYVVRFMDDDDVIQEVPGRYRFERPSDQEAAETISQSEFEGQRSARAEMANVRQWIEYYRSHPNRSQSIEEIRQAVSADLDRYKSAPPPELD
jgi:hypothetical protein